MQKRFCSCGQAVLVDYMLSGSLCDTMFRSDKQACGHGFSEQGDILLCCPHCGTLLNINELF